MVIAKTRQKQINPKTFSPIKFLRALSNLFEKEADSVTATGLPQTLYKLQLQAEKIGYPIYEVLRSRNIIQNKLSDAAFIETGKYVLLGLDKSVIKKIIKVALDDTINTELSGTKQTSVQLKLGSL